MLGTRNGLRNAGVFRVVCDGGDIKRVEKVRYLGVLLDQAVNVVKKVLVWGFYTVVPLSLTSILAGFCVMPWYSHVWTIV